MRDLDDRMKNNYEKRQRFYLIRRIPVIIRVDGNAFHKLTKNMQKPFDEDFINSMKSAAKSVFDEMQGCKLIFVQSDEASFLLTDYDSNHTEAWFDYNLFKLVSITAAKMSIHFYKTIELIRDVCPLFDARAFNVPREEVANYFLWRAKDWYRNSILMYAQSFFSHNQMQNKNIADLHEMLNSINRNWTTDLPEHLRNGSWYFNKQWKSNILPKYESINKIIKPFINNEEDEVK